MKIIRNSVKATGAQKFKLLIRTSFLAIENDKLGKISHASHRQELKLLLHYLNIVVDILDMKAPKRS